MELLSEWRETDRARRRKSEGKVHVQSLNAIQILFLCDPFIQFYNFLNRSAQSLTRSKSQDGKARRVSDKLHKDLDDSQATHDAASRLPVYSGYVDKAPGNHHFTHATTHALQMNGVTTSPVELFKPSSPAQPSPAQPNRIVTSPTQTKATVTSPTSNNSARSPSSASRQALSPVSPTPKRDALASGLLLNRPLAPPITPTNSAGRKVLGILLPSSTVRRGAASDEEGRKRPTHHPRSGSGSSHEPLLPAQSRTSDREHTNHIMSSEAENTTVVLKSIRKNVSPERRAPALIVPPNTSMRSQRGTATQRDMAEPNMTSSMPRKSVAKLDFWKATEPRAPGDSTNVRTGGKDKGKQRSVFPVANNTTSEIPMLHSPQARAPVTFLPQVPKVKTIPPTPQKVEKSQAPTSARVDSFLSDSILIPQPDTNRLVPPTSDPSPLSRHPAFAQPNANPHESHPFAPALGMHRSKSAPTSSKGRTSPCLRIPSPKFLNKDKDKEIREKREKREKRKVTPENVSSPIIRDTRHLPGEKPVVNNVTKVPVRRTTLGTFDFERPGSRGSSKSGGQSESKSGRSDDEKENEKAQHQRSVNQGNTQTTTRREVVITRMESPKIKAKAPSPVPPLPTSRMKVRSPPPPRTRSPLAATPTTAGSQSISGDIDDSTLPRLASGLSRRNSGRTQQQRVHASHPSFSFEPAASASMRPFRDTGIALSSRTTSGAKSVSVRHSDQYIDTHSGLMWVPTKNKESVIPEDGNAVDFYSRARTPLGMAVKEAGSFSPRDLEEAMKVIEQFKKVLNDVGFATLQKCECQEFARTSRLNLIVHV